MRNNWARSPAGTRAVVKTAKIRVTSHLVIGAIHSSAVLHVVLKKPPPKPELDTVAKKKRKGNSGKKRGVAETTNDDEGTKEDDTSVVDVKLAPKGTTTAHFIKFVNELLNIRDEDESLKGGYLVIDNASIHKSKPMIRKIKARYYKVMYLPLYSPELNPSEQFWALVKGKMKRHRLMKEETLSSRIGDACNNVRFSDLYGFCLHSKHQIINCFKRTPF
ncbi:hypothetical protein G6F22_011935 [Rhizopus arrhizus]|nr:hypothetical protein G6F22_011935 [Rhizopus arrhizus]